jgi:hypothetical protein
MYIKLYNSCLNIFSHFSFEVYYKPDLQSIPKMSRFWSAEVRWDRVKERTWLDN